MQTLLLVAALAGLELPAVFTDHMVLQRDRPILVWGRATPGASVRVTLSDRIPQTTCAGPDGSWRILLPAESASQAPRTVRIEGDGDDRTIIDVLVGEVWLCGGQSNMEWPVHASLDHEAEQARAAQRPTIRAIKVPHTIAAAPAFSTQAAWRIATPDAVLGMSAVGYTMATELQDTLNGVPIGLLEINWGGTRIEPWIDAASLAACPVTRAPWAAACARVQADPAQAADVAGQFAGMFNAMIAPFAPFPIRGAIWYQGESNAGQPEAYRTLLPTLIDSWRSAFDHHAMPFGVVQLASFMKQSDDPVDGGWAPLRDAQLETAQRDDMVGLVITTDIGDANDIHPRNKREVGRRLAAWATRTDWPRCGPAVTLWPAVATCDGASRLGLMVQFGGGEPVTTRDGAPPDGFAIAGTDGNFSWARTELRPDGVFLWSDGVPEPVAVRYAWSSNPVRANLVDQRGLPIGPFRSDRPARE